jgi:hypothetical protein
MSGDAVTTTREAATRATGEQLLSITSRTAPSHPWSEQNVPRDKGSSNIARSVSKAVAAMREFEVLGAILDRDGTAPACHKQWRMLWQTSARAKSNVSAHFL